MAKKKTTKKTTEKKASKNVFDDFEEKQGLLSQALASSTNLYSSEASPEDRLNARNFALAYASQTPALRHIVNKDDANVPNKVDSYLNLAKIQFTKERNYIVDKKREEVVGCAPEKGLAKIVYGLDPEPIKQNDSYKEDYKAHSKFKGLSEILMAVQQGKASPEGLAKEVGNYLREDVDEGYKNNEALKDDKEYKEALINTALSGLGQRELIAVAGNID